jgi:putative ABC transport system substrate-binding protein
VIALQKATRTIPIVFAQVPDPVRVGLVHSLARPGGNITGFMLFDFPIAGKWLELLKQLAPATRHAVALSYPASPTQADYIRAASNAAGPLDVLLSELAVRDAAEIESAIARAAKEPDTGLVVLPSPLTSAHRSLIARLAADHALPAVYAYRYFPASGGLASYGVDNIDTFRRAASYVDRILKGEKAGDLPVQAPTKYELTINLKAARALKLDVPLMLLARADEVIE